jgi:hypothetical protein
MSGREELESTTTEPSSRLFHPNAAADEAKLSSGLNALGWSAGVAVLTALATCAGMVREAGSGGSQAYNFSHDSVANTERRIGLSGKALAGIGNEARPRALGKCDQGENRQDSSRNSRFAG